MRTLNDLSYPYDYVLEEGPVPVDVTGTKNFDRLTVDRLTHVFSINNVGINEFVTLEDDHVFQEEITFHNITVLGPFTVYKRLSFTRSRPLIVEKENVNVQLIYIFFLFDFL